MKKLFLFTTALAASISLNAQFAKFDGIAAAEETEYTALYAGTTLATTNAFNASVAFDDNYHTVNLKHEGYGWWEIDGANVNAAADTLGLRGATTPKDVDLGNPANACTTPAFGAVFQVEAKADGYLFIFHKASSNKQYMVEENGIPVGYHFGMVTTDVDGYFGEAGATKVIEYTIEGNNELGQITDGRKLMFAEDYVKQENDPNIGTAVYKRNGLGVISVPCYKGCTYWFHPTGSKMSAIGVAYYPVDKDVFVVNEDGTKVKIYTANGYNNNDKCGDNLTWSYDTDTKALTIEGSGEMYDYDVWSSNQPWAYVKGDILSVSLPEGLTSIGDGAFWECSSLTSIILPNSVKSIGERAFKNCSSLTSIILPNSLTSIEYDAFADCSSLTSITIPNSVTSIGHGAFAGCSSLTSIILPNSLTSIEYDAFADCSSLTSITIPNSVTSIGNYAFYNCSSLTSITIPNSVTSIGESAFNSCSALTSITIPNSVTSIGGDAFYGCSALTSITLPNSVTSIGGNAFYGCSSLTSVVWNAKNCAGWSYYDSAPFYEIRANITSFTFGEEVETIPSYLCYGMSSLTSITLPNSVTNIGSSAFYGCSSLTSVVWNAKNCAGWSYYDSAPFYEIRANITSFTFGEEVETIPSHLCSGMSSLTSITFPKSVTSIGNSAFSDCSSLTSITLPNSVTSIGNFAFRDCSALTSITIPNSVTSIGERAFYYCSSLTSITLPNSVTSIGSEAFYKCSALTKLICEGHVENIDGSAISYCYALDTIVISAQAFDVEESLWIPMPKNIRYIQLTGGELTDNAFNVILRSYKTLGTLDLATAANTTLSDEAFKGCYNLQTLVLPAQLTSIPYMAVADCKALQAITIPATVEEIDNSAFENCRSIRSITFEGAAVPENGGANFAPAAATSALWRIGNWAFYNCHQLQHLTIPESVTEIGDAAFYGCTYLEDMTLPSSMRKIGDNTFALCTKLQKIHVRALVPPIICAKTFYDVNRAIPVYVPDEAVADYKADTYWQEFNIVGESNTPMGIENTNSEINAQGVQKRLHNGQVLIIRGDKTYTILGEAL